MNSEGTESNDLITRILGCIIVLLSLPGLYFNISVFRHFLFIEKTSFYILCMPKTISNSFIILVNLLYGAPSAILCQIIGPDWLNGYMSQAIGFGIYMMGLPESCRVKLTLDPLGWTTDYCNIGYAFYFFQYFLHLIISLGVISNFLNLLVVIKLALSACKAKSLSSESSRRRHKTTVRLFIQSCIQDWIYVFDMINGMWLAQVLTGNLLILETGMYMAIQGVDGLIVRNVSKDLRQFADRSSYHFTTISVTFEKCQVALKLTYPQEKKAFLIEYRQARNPYNRQKSFNWRQVGGRFDPVEQVLRDLAVIFKHPNSSIDQLDLSSNDRITRQSMKTKKTFLDTFYRTVARHLLAIKGINIGWSMDQDEMLQMLTSIKPSTLGWIKLEATSDNSMEDVVQTEQFQNADRLAVKNGRLGCLLKGRIGTVTKILNTEATLDDLKDLLTALLNKNDINSFDFLLQDVSCNIKDFLNHLEDAYGLMPVGNDYVMKKNNSEDYLIIVPDGSHICFFGMDKVEGLKFLNEEYAVLEGNNDN